MDWYSVRSEQAARMLVIEFERLVLRLRESPLRWPTYRHGTRKARLRRFPFPIIYWVGMDDVQVVAVAHLHRRPGYWQSRTLG